MAATTEPVDTKEDAFLDEWEYLNNVSDFSEDTGNFVPKKSEQDE